MSSEYRAASIPAMPEGFTDRAAWDAIHWRFSEDGSLLDEAVMGWQRDNQERVKAAAEASREVRCAECGEKLKESEVLALRLDLDFIPHGERGHLIRVEA